MQFRKLFAFAMALLFIAPAFGQFSFSNSSVPAAGFTYQYIRRYDQLSFVTEAGFNQLHVENYLVLAQKNDVVSVGVNTGISAGLNRSFAQNRIFFNYNVQAPIMAMARLGANSSPYNNQRFGLGVGVGGTVNHFRNIQNNASIRRRATFVNPSVLLEASYGPTIFRAHFDVIGVTSNWKGENVITGADAPLDAARFGYINLGVLFSFR